MLDFGKDKQFANWTINFSKDVYIGKPSNYMGPFPAALKLPEYLILLPANKAREENNDVLSVTLTVNISKKLKLNIQQWEWSNKNGVTPELTSFNRDHATQPGISTHQQCRFHTNNLQKLAQFSKHQTIRPKNPKLSKTQKAPPEKCTRITWFPQNISKSLHFFKETKLLVPSTPPTVPSSEILRQAIASLPLCVPRRRDACVFPRGRRPPRSWRWVKTWCCTTCPRAPADLSWPSGSSRCCFQASRIEVFGSYFRSDFSVATGDSSPCFTIDVITMDTLSVPQLTYEATRSTLDSIGPRSELVIQHGANNPRWPSI